METFVGCRGSTPRRTVYTHSDKSKPQVQKLWWQIILFGFRSVFVTWGERRQCVVRKRCLPADRMKSSKLKRHLERSRANLANNLEIFPIKNMKWINETAVNLNIQPSIYIHLSFLASCKSDCTVQRAPCNRRKFNHFFLFPLNTHNVLCAFTGIQRSDWLQDCTLWKASK